MSPRSTASGDHRTLKFHLATCAALLLLSLGGCGGAQSRRDAPARAPVIHASAAQPVVVEEFQSQGCSSCPPATANVNALADRPEILALSYAVTYWDQLGWKDTFDRPAFTQRQWDYAHYAGRANVATPQVIVNGKTAIVGSNRGELDALVARNGAPRGGPAITSSGKAVAVGTGKPEQPATVWLVRYDPKVQWVAIRAGENEGRKLPHRDIVRELVALGKWSGKATEFAVPAASRMGLRSAVLVQAGTGGPIIAARRV
jgi:hypothetical protein